MAIEARHVSRTFGSWAALRDVSLAVSHGELVALLGPSGSGKTTLLRIIAGLEQPDPSDETAVLINGVNISSQRPDERKVGFVFQHYALFRHMSVFENIAFGLRVRPKKVRPSEPAIRRRVGELLELIQLGRWSDQYPSQLSGGQRQRVALARALAIEPNVLLLDEPFGALDARVRQELRRWLRTLHSRIPVTSLLVTHDQEEALEVADRVAIMNHGRIEQFGTPDEVFHHPASEFVVTFLGNVNLFHGRVASGKAVIGRLAVDASRALPYMATLPVPANGDKARVFVRPHELDIDVNRTDDTSVRARVLRIQSAGSLVRVELASEEDETVRTEDTLNVELTHQRHRELTLRLGDTVFVRLRDARVFKEDYTI
jgi:sulfate transport system ATP-binding protein